MMRTLELALAATLFTTGCFNARATRAETERTAERTAEVRAPMRAAITEPQVATAVAAMGSGTIALEEDSPGLLERARVTDANARVIALQRVRGGRIVEAELDEEGGRVIYSYEIRVADGRAFVEIDAGTGVVLRERREQADDEHGDDEHDASEHEERDPSEH
jgi:uncharacterized membrane protein YkoI